MRKQRRRSAVQCAVTAQLISAFVFATKIVQFLFYLYTKFQASNCDCTGQFMSDLVGTTEGRFSHVAAQLWMELSGMPRRLEWIKLASYILSKPPSVQCKLIAGTNSSLLSSLKKQKKKKKKKKKSLVEKSPRRSHLPANRESTHSMSSNRGTASTFKTSNQIGEIHVFWRQVWITSRRVTQLCSWKYEHRWTSNGSSKEVLEKCKYQANVSLTSWREVHFEPSRCLSM